jgi:hypothetical protein
MKKLLPTHRHFYPLYPISSLILFVVLMFFGEEGRGQILINETLRSGSLPVGWSQTDVTFTTAASGYANFTSTSAILTTPSFDASGYTSIEVSLSVAKFGTGGDGPITIEYSLNGGSLWSFAGNSSTPNSSTYINDKIEISTTSSNMVIRFTRIISPSQKRLRDVIITGTGLASTPTISISGNSQPINNGSTTPSVSNHTDFENMDVTSGTQVRTFTINNTGTANLELTGSPYVTISGSHASDFTVTNQPAISTIAPAGSTTFQITFDPSALGIRNAIVTILNNDNAEFTFAISGNGTNSNLSDIIEDNSLTYTENIIYNDYQLDVITNVSQSVGVFKFRVRDGGYGANDSDALSTQLNSITFFVSNIENIRSAALFGGVTQVAMLNNTPVINYGSGTLSFTGLNGSDFTAPDNGEVPITLRVSFQTTVTDNHQLQFTITQATASSEGSSFAENNAGGASSSITGDRNRIEVTADRLAFVQQPSNTTVLTSMTPAVTVQGEDVNGNRDLDYNEIVSISSSGTMTGDPVAVNALAGLATFSGLEHNVAGDDLELTATTTGLAHSNSLASNLFDIIEFEFLLGDYRPLIPGTDFSANGNWEYFNGATWTSPPDDDAPQNATIKPLRIIIDKAAIGGGGNSSSSYNDIIILKGGELFLENNAVPSSDFISAGRTLEVQDGGNLVINGQIQLNSSANLIVRNGGSVTLNNASIDNEHVIWNGNENFESGSTINITNWNWSTSPGQRSILNTPVNISDNTNGWKFGNLILDVIPSDSWTLVGGGIGIINLCENDLDIGNSSSNYILGASNSNTVGFVVNGNMTIYDGPFSFGASFSTGGFNQQFTINGDFTCESGDVLKIHHNGNGTPTSLSGSVTFNGDVVIGSSVLSFANDGASGTPARMGVNLNGGTPVDPKIINISPVAVAIDIDVKSGSARLLSGNDLVTNSAAGYISSITIESDAFFHFGWAHDNVTPLVIRKTSFVPAGTNIFNTLQGSTLVITSPEGIQQSSANTGNIQYSNTNKFINQTATFHYVGKQNQVTGDAITTGSTGKILIVELENDTDFLTLTNGIGISNGTLLGPLGGRLEIRSGTLVSSAANPINGSGRLVMSGGTYQIGELTTVPQLTGSYQLTGGTVELNGGEGSQTLRGLREYNSLTFSGGGTKTTSSAINGINGIVTIKDDNTVLDVANSEFSGSAELVMTNESLFRMSKVSTSLPQLTGDYSLTGGTIEWYGTTSTQTHSIRGGKTYHNLEINAGALNDGFDEANVVVGSSFQVNGTMNVNFPASLKVSGNFTISGTGRVNINGDATLKYGSAEGISSIGTTGNIQTDSRVFSSLAGYSLIGSVDQVTGTGLPANVNRLSIEKTNPENIVTLTNLVAVSERLYMRRGILVNPDHELIVGLSAELPGYLIYEEGLISGKITRWIPASTGSFLFPVGKTTYNPATIEFTSSANGGTLTAEFIEEIPIGYLGNLPLTNEGITFNTLSEKGFWRIEAGNGLSGGVYTLSLDASGFPGVDVPQNIRILKSPSESYNWSIDGTFDSFLADVIIHSGMSGFSDFALGGDSNENPLPVELLYFTATVNNNEVGLSWATASEINNNFFTLERSADMLSVEIIGQVQGAGNSNQTLAYQFTDLHPLPGTSYYRLKQTDFDGSFEYSDWTTATLEITKKQTLEIVNIFYNSDHTVVRAKVQPGEPLKIQVFDLFGKEVFSHEYVPEKSTIEHTFSHYKKGLYIIRLTDNYNFQTRKFVNP